MIRATACIILAIIIVASAGKAAASLPLHEISAIGGTREIVLQSKILGEQRHLWVRLPQGYGDGADEYPVLYVLDAEWHFNIAAADVELLSECSYISPHPAPQMIVVGVVNTDRNRDFTPTNCPAYAGMKFPTSGESNRFRRFMVEEVLPLVDATYRTRPYRILAGWSLGGLFTVETLLSDDPVFDSFLAISPSLWWDAEWVLNELQEGALGAGSADPRQLVVTLGSVEKDRGSMVATSTAGFVSHLEEQPLAGVDFELVPIEGLGHNYSPKDAYFYGLATIFADLSLPTDVRDQGLAAIDAYYASLSRRYKSEITVPEDVYGELGWQLFEADRRDEAREIFAAWAERHPRSSVALASLGSFCRETGDTERAVQLFREAVVLEENAERPRRGFIADLRRDIDAVQGDG